MVYLIKCTVNNVCKIGFSDNPKDRLQQLQTSYPHKLELISTIDGDISTERFIHDYFKEFNTHGEWFMYNDLIKSYFDNYILQNKESGNLIAKFQRNADGFFDATSLLNEFNSLTIGNPKKMEDYKKLKETKTLCEYLIINENINTTPILSTIKGTWMHYIVFLDFAIWLSLEYKVKVLEWFFENKITTKNIDGKYHKEMCKELLTQRNALQKETSFFHYIQEANMLRSLAGIEKRDIASEDKLNLLNTLQKANIKLIRSGLGKEKRYNELYNLKNLIS